MLSLLASLALAEPRTCRTSPDGLPFYSSLSNSYTYDDLNDPFPNLALVDQFRSYINDPSFTTAGTAAVSGATFTVARELCSGDVEEGDPDGGLSGCGYCPCVAKCPTGDGALVSTAFGTASGDPAGTFVRSSAVTQIPSGGTASVTTALGTQPEVSSFYSTLARQPTLYKSACTWETCAFRGRRLCPEGYQCCLSERAVAAGLSCGEQDAATHPTDFTCIPCQAAGYGDVHLVGFRGQNFDIDGRNNTWFSFFVDEGIAVNVFLKFFPSHYSWPTGSVISKVAIVAPGEESKLMYDVDSDQPAQLYPSPVPLSTDSDAQLFKFGECGSVQWESSSRLVVKVGGYKISVSRQEFFDQRGSEHGKFLNVDIRAPGATEHVAGLLGDTWHLRDGRYNPLRDSERAFIIEKPFDVSGKYLHYSPKQSEFMWVKGELPSSQESKCTAVNTLPPVRIGSSKDLLPAHLRHQKAPLDAKK